MSGGLFSGMSVVVPAASDEDPAWIADIVAVARGEASEVLIVLEADADSIAMRPAIGGFERVRLVFQRGPADKSGALNTGLEDAKNEFVVFVDADIVLEPGMLTTLRDMYDDGALFIGANYGRKPSFPILSPSSGWLFAAKRSLLIELGGWSDDYLEDVATARKIQRAGYRIYTAPFSVQLRRGVRRPLTKFVSAAFTRG